MQNFGTWLPTSAIILSQINIPVKDPSSRVLDFFISSSYPPLLHHRHPLSWTHPQPCHQMELPYHWNPKFKHLTTQPAILPTLSLNFSSYWGLQISWLLYFLSINSFHLSFFTPVYKTQFITSTTICHVLFLIKPTWKFLILLIMQLTFSFLHWTSECC